MFPSKGTPRGCGIGVVMVLCAIKIYIGDRERAEERVGVAETKGEEGGVKACRRTESGMLGSP